MAVLSFFLIIGGICLYAYGNTLNNDTEARLESFFENGNANPGEKWMIFGGIVAVVGIILLIYALVKDKGDDRPEAPTQDDNRNCGTLCPECGAPLVEESKFCMKCGRPVDIQEPVETEIFCYNCGQKIPKESKFCLHCGTTVPELPNK